MALSVEWLKKMGWNKIPTPLEAEKKLQEFCNKHSVGTYAAPYVSNTHSCCSLQEVNCFEGTLKDLDSALLKALSSPDNEHALCYFSVKPKYTNMFLKVGFEKVCEFQSRHAEANKQSNSEEVVSMLLLTY